MKLYRKKAIQPMFPWIEGISMNTVSVSEADRENGSPKLGDMIAYNPDNPEDRWLVAEQYFLDNYEEIPDTQAERVEG